MESKINYNLTINTDASFSPITKRGGYGIWICYQDKKFQAYGGFKDLLVDSTEAELKAVLNAFHIISSWTVRVDRVIVNCDNKGVRDFIDQQTFLVKEKYRSLVKTLKEYTNKYPMVYSKKIKGHQDPNTSPRNYVNNWCDRKATEGRLEVEQVLGVQTKIEFSTVITEYSYTV
jgi:ribonuclease HI